VLKFDIKIQNKYYCTEYALKTATNKEALIAGFFLYSILNKTVGQL
jgi:hypothetical protein